MLGDALLGNLRLGDTSVSMVMFGGATIWMPPAPEALSGNMWAVADAADADGFIDIGIAVLPDDNGAANPRLEYSLDAVGDDTAPTWAPLAGGWATGTRRVPADIGATAHVALRVVWDSGTGPATAPKSVDVIGAPSAVGSIDAASGVVGAGDIAIALDPFFARTSFGAWSIHAVDPVENAGRFDISLGAEGGASLVVSTGEPMGTTTATVRYANPKGFAEQAMSVAVASGVSLMTGETVSVEGSAGALINPEGMDIATGGGSWNDLFGGGKVTLASPNPGPDGELPFIRATFAGATAFQTRRAQFVAQPDTTYHALVFVRPGPTPPTHVGFAVNTTETGSPNATMRWPWSSLDSAPITGGSSTPPVVFGSWSWAAMGSWSVLRVAFTTIAALTANQTMRVCIATGSSLIDGGLDIGPVLVSTAAFAQRATVDVLANDTQTRVTEVNGSGAKVGAPVVFNRTGVTRIASDGAAIIEPGLMLAAQSGTIAHGGDDGAGGNLSSAALTVSGIAPPPPVPVIADDTAQIAGYPGSGSLMVKGDGPFDPHQIAAAAANDGFLLAGGTTPSLAAVADGQIGEMKVTLVTTPADHLSGFSGFGPRFNATAGETYRVEIWYAPTTATGYSLRLHTGSNVITKSWSGDADPGVTIHGGMRRMVWFVTPGATGEAHVRFRAHTNGAVRVGAIIVTVGATDLAISTPAPGVLGNDDQVRVTAVKTDAGLVGAPVVTDGSVAVINADGSWFFSPGVSLLDDTDSVVIGYTADDGAAGGSASATLTIDGPEIAPPPATGTPAEIQVAPSLAESRVSFLNSTHLMADIYDGEVIYGTPGPASETPAAGWTLEDDPTRPAGDRAMKLPYMSLAPSPWRNFVLAVNDTNTSPADTPANWTVTVNGSPVAVSNVYRNAAAESHVQRSGTSTHDMVYRHRCTLQLASAAPAGAVVVVTPSGYPALPSVTRTDAVRSEAIHVVQTGYHPAMTKIALVGQWFGRNSTDANVGLELSNSTAWRLQAYDGAAWTNVAGISGTLGTPVHTPTSSITIQTGPIADFTGCDVWEIDFTAYAGPADRCRIVVTGVGCSHEFPVTAAAVTDVLRHTCRTFFHLRNNFDFTPGPYTPYGPAPGVFRKPWDGTPREFVATTTRIEECSKDGPAGSEVSVNLFDPHRGANFGTPAQHFSLLPNNIQVPAETFTVRYGHRDAGDLDTRPQHILRFYGFLNMLVAFPGLRTLNLYLPESNQPYNRTVREFDKAGGPGDVTREGETILPDFLHEILWTADHWREMQEGDVWWDARGTGSSVAGTRATNPRYTVDGADRVSFRGAVRSGVEISGYNSNQGGTGGWEPPGTTHYIYGYSPMGAYAYAGLAGYAAAVIRWWCKAQNGGTVPTADEAIAAAYERSAVAAYAWAQTQNASTDRKVSTAVRNSSEWRQSVACARMGLWIATGDTAYLNAYTNVGTTNSATEDTVSPTSVAAQPYAAPSYVLAHAHGLRTAPSTSGSFASIVNGMKTAANWTPSTYVMGKPSDTGLSRRQGWSFTSLGLTGRQWYFAALLKGLPGLNITNSPFNSTAVNFAQAAALASRDVVPALGGTMQNMTAIVGVGKKYPRDCVWRNRKSLGGAALSIPPGFGMFGLIEPDELSDPAKIGGWQAKGGYPRPVGSTGAWRWPAMAAQFTTADHSYTSEGGIRSQQTSNLIGVAALDHLLAG